MAIPHGAPPLQMARPKQSQGRGVATEPFRTAEGRRASFNAIRTPASRYTDRMVGKYTRLSWFQAVVWYIQQFVVPISPFRFLGLVFHP